MRKIYTVTTRPSGLRPEEFAVAVHPNRDGTWFATNPLLGCGKDGATEERAIRTLVQDHAYTILTIVAK